MSSWEIGSWERGGRGARDLAQRRWWQQPVRICLEVTENATVIAILAGSFELAGHAVPGLSDLTLIRPTGGLLHG